MTTRKPKVGDVVLYKNRLAIVRYSGITDFSNNERIYGIEIKGISSVMSGNDGEINDKQYFQCKLPNHGLFVNLKDISRVVAAEEILDKLAFVHDNFRMLQIQKGDQNQNQNQNENQNQVMGGVRGKARDSYNSELHEQYVNAVTFIGSMMAGAVFSTESKQPLSKEFKQLTMQLILHQLQNTHKTKQKQKQNKKNSNSNSNSNGNNSNNSNNASNVVKHFLDNNDGLQRNLLNTSTEKIPGYIKKLMYSYCMNVKQITPVWKYFNFAFMDKNLNPSNVRSESKCFQFMKPYLCYSDCQWIKMDVVLGLFPNLTTICVAGVVFTDNVFEKILQDLRNLNKTSDENENENENDFDDQKDNTFQENIANILSNRLTSIEIVGPEMVQSSTETTNSLNSGIIDSIIERFDMDFEAESWNIVKSTNKFENEWISILHNSIY